MKEIDSPYRGYMTTDGRIFTGRPVHSALDLDRGRITVCANHDEAKRLAQEHEKTLQ